MAFFSPRSGAHGRHNGGGDSCDWQGRRLRGALSNARCWPGLGSFLLLVLRTQEVVNPNSSSSNSGSRGTIAA